MTYRFEAHRNVDDALVAEGILFTDGVCVARTTVAPRHTETWANLNYMMGDWTDRNCSVVWVDPLPEE